MLSHNLDDFIAWAQSYIDQLSPREQHKLLQKIAHELRQANQRRMQSQQTPDGAAWAPRKAQKGKVLRRQMFKKLRQNKNFKIKTHRNGIRLGFFGIVGRTARVHHYGLRERLQYGLADYSARELIGVNEADKNIIKDNIINHLREAKHEF